MEAPTTNNPPQLKDLLRTQVGELNARERILRTALILFNKNGVHTTGIDRVIAESGVAKMTLYKYFPTKAKLIAEYLRYKDQVWFARFDARTRVPGLNPSERFLALFDALEDWFKEDDFLGCPFIKGLSEFGGERNEPEIQAVIISHFGKTLELLGTLLKEISPDDYASLVPKMMSLVAGATILAQATRDASAAQVNKEIARQLLIPLRSRSTGKKKRKPRS